MSSAPPVNATKPNEEIRTQNELLKQLSREQQSLSSELDGVVALMDDERTQTSVKLWQLDALLDDTDPDLLHPLRSQGVNNTLKNTF